MVSYCGVRDVNKTKGIMGSIGILNGRCELPGAGEAGEEGRGAELRLLECTGSRCAVSAQLCDIARRRSQEKPDQIYRCICKSWQEGLYDPVRIVPRRK